MVFLFFYFSKNKKEKKIVNKKTCQLLRVANHSSTKRFSFFINICISSNKFLYKCIMIYCKRLNL